MKSLRSLVQIKIKIEQKIKFDFLRGWGLGVWGLGVGVWGLGGLGLMYGVWGWAGRGVGA